MSSRGKPPDFEHPSQGALDYATDAPQREYRISVVASVGILCLNAFWLFLMLGYGTGRVDSIAHLFTALPIFILAIFPVALLAWFAWQDLHNFDSGRPRLSFPLLHVSLLVAVPVLIVWIKIMMLSD